MKAVIACEHFGPTASERMRPYLYPVLPPQHWVARIVGRDARGRLVRRHVRGKWDHERDRGMRGTFVYYTIESGSFYEVLQRIGWDRKKSRHYYCTVNDDGDVVEVEREEVERWASAASG